MMADAQIEQIVATMMTLKNQSQDTQRASFVTEARDRDLQLDTESAPSHVDESSFLSKQAFMQGVEEACQQS